MKNDRSKYLLKNTAVFTIGNLATRLISFVLIPLYTNVLTTAEYGIADLVVTICTITVPIITLNIAESVMRFNLDKDSNSDSITKIGLVVLLCGLVFGSVLIPVCSLFAQVKGFGLLIYFYIVFSASSQVFLCDLRGKELIVKYTIGNILMTLMVAIFNIVFLLYFSWGIKGYLAAYCLSYLLTSVYAVIVGKLYRSFAIPIEIGKMKEMLKYSIVLIPNSFMWWIMNSSDHVMVTSMIGVAANGVYAISYKLPNLISTFTGIFNQAWQYSAIREESSYDKEEYVNRVLETMIVSVMLIGIGMLTFIKPFLRLYVSLDYYLAWKYTPFLIIGCVFLTLGTFMATTYNVHKDSCGFLVSGSIGAIINIILNFILIPMIGVFGAAIATCISYIAVFSFRVFHTRKYIHYKVITKAFVFGSFIMFISSCIMFIENTFSFVIQLILLLIYCCIFRNYWSPIFDLIKLKIKRK